MSETKTTLVRYEVKDKGIYTLTLDNPPLNIFTDELINQLAVVVDEILSKSDCRVLIITGKGEKAFAAGADVNQFTNLDYKSGKQLVEKGKKIYNKLECAPFPVIAAINGHALGGGLELTLACDLRVAEKKAKLGLPETGLGIIPGYGGTQRLARLIGPGKAKELLFTGALLSGEEAYEKGMVEKLVPNGGSYQAALTLAEQIASKAPLAIKSAKQVVNQGLEVSLAEGQALETNLVAELWLTDDSQEGVKSFKENRKPKFVGK